MKKTVFLFTVIFFLVYSVAGFAAFPYDRSKTSDDLNLSYRVGLINPGKTDLRIRLGVEESPNYTAGFSRNSFILEGNSTTRDPSGSGWYYLGDGRYARIRQVRLDIDFSRYRDSNRFDIPLTVEAIPVSDSGGNATAQVAQVRSYSLEARLAEFLVPREREKQDEGSEFWKEARNNPEDFNTEQDQVSKERTEGSTAESERADTSDRKPPETVKNRDSGFNEVTLFLIAGIMVLTLYILREI